MRLADFFIGKPGPGSISEALVMGLPVILERNASTMIQERFNTDWVGRNHLGLVLNSFAKIDEALAIMVNPGELARMRAQVGKFKNRALFEIPEIFEEIIQRRPESCPRSLSNVGLMLRRSASEFRRSTRSLVCIRERRSEA
jgi:1,2-diacylglycerol 3-beta-galactosyltransferase